MFEIRLIANKTSASIIVITETWLDNTVNDTEISIPGQGRSHGILITLVCGGGGVRAPTKISKFDISNDAFWRNPVNTESTGPVATVLQCIV